MTYNPQNPQQIPPQATGGDPNDKTMSILPHLLTIFLSFIGPLIFYILYKDKPGAVKDNSREALNFSLVVLIASFLFGIGAFLLTVLTLGLMSFVGILAYLPYVAGVIFNVIACVKVSETGFYKYPFNFDFVK